MSLVGSLPVHLQGLPRLKGSVCPIAEEKYGLMSFPQGH